MIIVIIMIIDFIVGKFILTSIMLHKFNIVHKSDFIIIYIFTLTLCFSSIIYFIYDIITKLSSSYSLEYLATIQTSFLTKI